MSTYGVISVHISLSAPDDYSSLSANITFSPGGVGAFCFNITIAMDLRVEFIEFFAIDLNSADAATQLPPSSVIFVLDASGMCVLLS